MHTQQCRLEKARMKKQYAFVINSEIPIRSTLINNLQDPTETNTAPCVRNAQQRILICC